ncbi:MAG: UDP-N-acetylmuramoyl-L-alanyl-D-glutamate--2,6-diaminopimelate ligase [Elusimicrobiota bacterium]|jgi:UDP-N-acetylmuramoyl-L-alanyl-D-glutamate--2,6-diaminopimelate ligase|nr:UDP-N-acetylmuramoyl-L-alanyl-D-glutamate--2,6-diaminopimelate ligase [Elusimicrobiota bacterium]
MTLKDLFGQYQQNLPAMEVKGITQNSAEVLAGFVFFAVKGHSVDGHNFIDAAIKNGAIAIVSEEEIKQTTSVPVIKVSNIDEAMANVACKFYNNPAGKLGVVGITGTKGKTSIAYLLESILMTAGRRPTVFGTINYRINGEVISQAPNTTPVALTLQKMIAQAAAQKSTDLVMEVSSHALELKRVDGIAFDTAIFTNLQRDHLDFHHNFKNYFAAKKKLFENLLNDANSVQNAPQKNRFAVINEDDHYGQRLIAFLKDTKVKVLTYGIENKADFMASDIKADINGVDFKINGLPAHINLLGKHNVYNALAATAAAKTRNVNLETAIKGLAALTGVPGRMERVNLGQKFYVFVDFAYTNEALLRAYDTVVPFKKGKIITVFGCGGQRDTTKRPLMGATAAKYSDLVLITKDNPRKEDPNNIFIDILKGMAWQDNFKIIPDRRQAIFEAIKTAKQQDIVIIAGKGHEDYQILPSGKIHFSDKEEAVKAIKNYV